MHFTAMSEKEFRKCFGRYIKARLAYYDKSQTDLATTMNVSTTTISSYQRGITFPSIERLLTIIAYFYDDLASWAEEMQDLSGVIKAESNEAKDRLELLKEAKKKLDESSYQGRK